MSVQVQQLAGLLTTAPQYLWEGLLHQILGLLNPPPTPSFGIPPEPIGVDVVVQLMHFLTSNEGGDSPISPELCMHLRVELARCLADAFAS